MLLKKLSKALGIIAIAFTVAAFATSCSNKITEEQLLKLQELRRSESNLNDQIAKKQAEKISLEKELSARQRELNDCEKNLEFVKKKLAQWPNVWPPDMFYEEPQPIK